MDTPVVRVLIYTHGHSILGALVYTMDTLMVGVLVYTHEYSSGGHPDLLPWTIQ